MNPVTLHALVAAGESQPLELKKSTAEKDRACRSLCAMATGVSVRTLQEWEQGRKVPNGAAQSLLKLVSRHPHLLAELT
jgi:transcriptional regulator with XRE-family HTH domain